MPWNPNGPATDVQSPTQLIMQYLASKGLPPTAQNVSRALQMNSLNPGVIPGLINQAPPSPDAQGGQQAAQGRPTSPPLPVPPIPPPQQAPAVSAAATGPTPTQPTQAPPQQDQSNNWLAQLMQTLLGGGAAVGAGAMRPGSSVGEPPLSMGLNPATSGGAQISNTPQIGQTLQLPQTPQVGGPGNSPQVGGPSPSAPQLPASAERPAIPMPNSTSGPTIPLPTSGLSGMGEPLPGRPAMPEMNSGIEWSKVLGEVAPLLRKMHP